MADRIHTATTAPDRRGDRVIDSASPFAKDERWIEIDLADLHLSSDMSSLDHRAEVASYIYERDLFWFLKTFKRQLYVELARRNRKNTV